MGLQSIVGGLELIQRPAEPGPRSLRVALQHVLLAVGGEPAHQPGHRLAGVLQLASQTHFIVALEQGHLPHFTEINREQLHLGWSLGVAVRLPGLGPGAPQGELPGSAILFDIFLHRVGHLPTSPRVNCVRPSTPPVRLRFPIFENPSRRVKYSPPPL